MSLLAFSPLVCAHQVLCSLNSSRGPPQLLNVSARFLEALFFSGGVCSPLCAMKRSREFQVLLCAPHASQDLGQGLNSDSLGQSASAAEALTLCSGM